MSINLPDRMSEAEIRRSLPEKYSSLPVFSYDEIDSTNTEAKRLISSGREGVFLVTAESQTAGRGRQGKSFYSPQSSGIYMSLVIRPQAEASDAVNITTASSVAVIRAIKALTDKEPGIKWVNDIYLNGKKICGILAEAVRGSSYELRGIVIGIGLNFYETALPDSLKDGACALSPSGITRAQLAAEICTRLLDISENLSDKSYMSEYRANSVIIGREINYFFGNESRRALAIGIEDDGGLIVRHPDGSETVLRSGEISVRAVK